jgi:nitroreductase
MDVLEAIRTRRSVRSYSGQPVEDEVLNQVLEAARLAPSANNRQEGRYVAVRDQAARHRLSIAAEGQGFVAEAAAVIACCAVESNHVMSCGQPAYSVDVSIAVDHMTLAAWSLGLGSCWIGAFDEGRVREILGIPESVRVVALLALGYPKHPSGARPRKPMNEIAHYERWKA